MIHVNELICQMETAAKNQPLNRRRMPVPNLILAAGHGAGVTTKLTEIAKKICDLELFVPAGEETYIEWALSEDERGFDQLLMRIRAAAGFYGDFRGFVALDLRNMLEGFSALPAMERLTALIRDSIGRIVFCFIIPEKLPVSLLEQCRTLLGRSAPAQCFCLPMLPPDAAVRYVKRSLEASGFTLHEKAAERLEETIGSIRSEQAYEGYHTLNNLVASILWMKNAKVRKSCITEEELAPLLRQYKRAVSMTEDGKNRRRIGFEWDERSRK